MKRNKSFFNIAQNFFEYVLICFALLECNSLYTSSINNGSDNVGILSLYIVCVSSFCAIVSILLKEETLKLEVKKYILIFIIVYLGLIIFGVVTARNQRELLFDYSIRFCVVLPLMCWLFYLKRKNKKGFDIWYKFSNVVFVIACINLILYCVFVFNADILCANGLQTVWSSLGQIRNLCNYFNFFNVELGLGKYFAGIFLPRNIGFYPEPLMYAIPLIISLYTEMFLQNSNRSRVSRYVIYTIVILTSQATLGILLAGLAWTLKSIEVYGRKIKKQAWVLIGCLVIAGGLFLVLAKYRNTSESFVAHIEDYIFALKAFLNKPLLGCGYGNEEYIRTFMSQYRLETNRGLSNSVAVVLAEGGVLLGGICMLPFFTGLIQIFNRKNMNYRKIAFWIVGTFGLYCVTIFHFHLILLMLMAFGYSLLEVNRKENRLVVSVWPEDEVIVEVNSKVKKKMARGQIVFTLSIATISLIALLTLKPIWTILFNYMLTNQLLIGDCVWNWMCLIIVFLFVITCLFEKSLLVTAKRNLLIYTVIFCIMRSWIFSWIHTFLVWKNLRSDSREAFALLTVFFAGIAFLFMWRLFYRKLQKRGKSILLIAPLLCAGALIGCVQVKLDQHKYVLKSEWQQLDDMMDVESGGVYVDDLPVFYHHFYPKTKYSFGSGKSFSAKKNATVIMSYDQNVVEMFDAGFVITQLSDRHVIYSNDEKMIQSLKEKGYVFYHYYPYATSVDMNYEAELNGLARTSDGGCIIEGEEKSLIYGPYSTLSPGEYEVEYSLHMDDVVQEGAVCRLQINAQYGQQVLTSREIFADEMDSDGNIVVSLPVSVRSDSSYLEFLVFGYGDQKIAINSIKYKEIYDYVTVRKYNGRNLVEQEMYYSADDDKPYAVDGGYYAVRKEYDCHQRIIEQKYYDADMQPIENAWGYASTTYQYNDGYGSVTNYYYLLNGEPVVFEEGNSGYTISYPTAGNAYQGKQIFLDKNGNTVTLKYGYAEIRWQTNERGQDVCRTFYDENSEVVNSIYGYAKRIQIYNERGQIIRREFYDLNGVPVDCTEGYSFVVWKYDENGELENNGCYNVRGELVWGTEVQ